MIPTFLDLRTGETAKSLFDMSLFWWSEGNGACDCNRHQAFPGATDPHWKEGCCFGTRRFVAIDVEGDLEYDETVTGERIPHTKGFVLAAINAEYGK